MNGYILAGQAIPPGDGHRAGRRLLEAMYREHIGGKMPDISIDSNGKPHFSRGNVHFSITHTRRHVFCALSDRPLGIDAEELDRPVNLRLAEKILSPGELRQFSRADDPRLALLTFWVLKEAQAKCAGTGLRGYPNHTDFSLTDPRVRIREGCLVAVIQEAAENAL